MIVKRARLAQRRKAVGLSQEKLADLLGVDVSTVRRWESGTTEPQPWHRPKIARVLKVSVEELSQLLTPGRCHQRSLQHEAEERRDLFSRLERVVEGRSRVDSTIVGHFANLLNEQRRLEDAIGGRPLLPMVLRQMETVHELRFGARGELLDEVLSLSASHAQFVAWMFQDSGDSLRALEYYSLTYDMAVEAADADMAATALSMKAHVAWSSGEPIRCQRFGEAAAETPGAATIVKAMAMQMAARGFAMQGEVKARQVLDSAAALLNRVLDPPDWMYFYGDIWLTLQTGMIEAHLHNWAHAAAMYRSGLARLPDHFTRDRAWYLSCLAVAEAENGDAEAALSFASAALPKAREVRNRHGIRQIERAASTLDGVGAREGRDLYELLRDTDPS